MLLNCEEIQPVHPKENQSWIFIGRTNAEAEIPILWPPDAKNWLIWKDPDAGKDWRQEEKGMTEDEMVRWHHWHSRCEFEQALGDGEGQGSLACCSPWGCQESDTTEWLNWTEGKTNHHGEQNKAITKWEQMQFPRNVSSQAQEALRGCVLRHLHQQGLASPISLEGKVHNQEKEGRSPWETSPWQDSRLPWWITRNLNDSWQACPQHLAPRATWEGSCSWGAAVICRYGAPRYVGHLSSLKVPLAVFAHLHKLAGCLGSPGVGRTWPRCHRGLGGNFI